MKEELYIKKNKAFPSRPIFISTPNLPKIVNHTIENTLFEVFIISDKRRSHQLYRASITVQCITHVIIAHRQLKKPARTLETKH